MYNRDFQLVEMKYYNSWMVNDENQRSIWLHLCNHHTHISIPIWKHTNENWNKNLKELNLRLLSDKVCPVDVVFYPLLMKIIAPKIWRRMINQMSFSEYEITWCWSTNQNLFKVCRNIRTSTLWSNENKSTLYYISK